jgi:Fe-S cluster assembly protein SufD
MNAILDAPTRGFLACYEATKNLLPGDLRVRDQAARLVAARGLPTPREEAWKYTPLRALNEFEFKTPGTATIAEARAFPALAAELGPRLTFINGRAQNLSPELPNGMRLESFAECPVLGMTADGQYNFIETLNVMLAADGAVLEVAEGQDANTLVLLQLAAPAEAEAIGLHVRHRITLKRKARLTLIELASGAGRYLHNPFIEIFLEEGALLRHVRLQEESAHAFHLAAVAAKLGAGARYDAFFLHLGAQLSRTELQVTLEEPSARLQFGAAQLLRGAQHGDITTEIYHHAPGCASRQTVKSVIDERARGVFQGRITVERGAQKTDGYQMNQALLLSSEAEIDSKPQLEIYADDVKCSHGATVGEIDPEQIFYLRSRGVPEAEARGILVQAFLAEALEAVEAETARNMLNAAIQRWWEGRAP